MTMTRCLGALALLAGTAQAAAPACDAGWQLDVQLRLGGTHGPSPGSTEWQAGVERQLMLADAPPRGGAAWCARVQQALDAARRAPVCRLRMGPDSIEGLTCRRAGLATLDLRLAQALSAARRQAARKERARLDAEQHGWLRGRNDCWKAGTTEEARFACVADSYRQRLLELQTRYRLVPVQASVRWRCDDGSQLTTHVYAATDPPSLVAQRAGQRSLMLMQPAASGARYAGPNESFWEHQGEARIRWGWQAPDIRCVKQP
jgi:uncharacterized protein